MFNCLMSKFKKILDTINQIKRPCYPIEISIFSKINHSTTRVYLRRLLKQRLVIQPFPGTYVTSPIHVMGSEPKIPKGFESPDLLPRVQNLCLIYRARSYAMESFREVRRVGSTKIRILYGKKYRKISVFVSNPWGLDLEGTYLTLDVAQNMIHKTLKIPLDIHVFKVVNMEWLNDVQAIRLEGLKVVTVRDFTGALEKIYNKPEGIRREVRIGSGSSIHQVLALWRGGIPLHQIVQGQQELVQEIRGLKDLLAAFINKKL